MAEGYASNPTRGGRGRGVGGGGGGRGGRGSSSSSRGRNGQSQQQEQGAIPAGTYSLPEYLREGPADREATDPDLDARATGEPGSVSKLKAQIRQTKRLLARVKSLKRLHLSEGFLLTLTIEERRRT